MLQDAEVLTGQPTEGNAIKGTLVLVAAQSLSSVSVVGVVSRAALPVSKELL